MKLFGRKPERYFLGLKSLPLFCTALWRAFFVFQNPLAIIWSYIVRRSPRGNVVRLRNGHAISLSRDPADIVTVFLIFAREDYGKVAPGTTVIDIGANIGVYALFAAFSGAKDVYAFEPSASSYEVLTKNIVANGLEPIIRAKCVAVVGLPSDPVKFPRSSNVMNAILPDSSESDDYDLVSTLTLSEIVSPLDSVDLLKMDCEGAEYDIILRTSEANILKVAEIRMEYHRGPRDELVARLTGFGYAVRQFMSEESGGGCLWLTRNSAL
jgi:FkbM family methyltransferase